MTIRDVATEGPPARRRDVRPSRAPRSVGTPDPVRIGRAPRRPIHPARQGLGPASRANGLSDPSRSARPPAGSDALTGQQSTAPFLRSQTDDDRPADGGELSSTRKVGPRARLSAGQEPRDLGASSRGGDEGEGVESESAGDPRLHPQPGVPETPGDGPTNGSTPASLMNPNNLGLSDLKKTGTTRKDPVDEFRKIRGRQQHDQPDASTVISAATGLTVDRWRRT